MRKNLVVGILKESSKRGERRAPLSPQDVKWLRKRKIQVEVESNKERVFKDKEYKRAGAKIVDKFKEASLLLGIKLPDQDQIYKNKIYMVFSHTIKGQKDNLPFLKAFIEKGVTLIDYEKITDLEGKRLVYFGRFAGICGLIDSFFYLGKRLEWQGIKNPFLVLKPAQNYHSLRAAVKGMKLLNRKIRKEGFERSISPFIVGLTGHGRVSQGAEEILSYLKPVEIHPRELVKFSRQSKRELGRKIYKIVFLREERFCSKDGHKFYFEEYLKHPERFESNMASFLPYLNILINASYWEKRYPRMVTKKMVESLYNKKKFRLSFIGDLACDVKGSIELTDKATKQDNPVFTYNIKKKRFVDGYKEEGITILAIDNLPTELPRDSSRDFSLQIRDYVYQIAAHGVKDITNHAALPKEIREAVIIQNKKLTRNFTYLGDYLD